MRIRNDSDHLSDRLEIGAVERIHTGDTRIAFTDSNGGIRGAIFLRPDEVRELREALDRVTGETIAAAFGPTGPYNG